MRRKLFAQIWCDLSKNWLGQPKLWQPDLKASAKIVESIDDSQLLSDYQREFVDLCHQEISAMITTLQVMNTHMVQAATNELIDQTKTINSKT